MALNTDFKVKNSLYVSNSACFVTQTNTATILSAGTSLFDIFLQEGEISAQCTLSNGTGITGINYNGQATSTISISAACNTAWNQAYTWCTTNGNNVIDTIIEGAAQGQIAVTNIGNTTSQVDVKDLGRDDSPVFASLSSTGNILVGGTVDGRYVSLDGITLDTLQSLSGDNGLDLTSTNQGTFSATSNDGVEELIDLSLKTTDSPTFNCVTATGDIIVSGTVDGRDIVNDGTTSDTLRSLSGANIVSVTSPSQGTLNTTCANGGTAVVIDTGLQTGDSPSFAGVTAGCVTVGVSTDNTITTGAGNILIGSSTGVITLTGNTHIGGDLKLGALCSGTSNTVLINATGGIIKSDVINAKVWGTGLVDGVGTTNTLPFFCNNDETLSDSMVSQATVGSNSTLTIGGSAIIQGDLTVTGDFTCLETLVQITSAVCIVNAGTGPALYAEQTGANQPIATFVDTEGGQVIIGDSGNVGIGTIGNVPGERLTVSGNLSANEDLYIDGAATIGGATTIGGIVCLGAGTVAGTSNTVIVSDSGVLKSDVIDDKVWCGKLVESATASTCTNNILKFTNTSGTIGNSNISDTGTLITLNSDVTYGNGATVKQPSAGGTVHTLDKVYVATVGTSATTVATFLKSGMNSVKYEVTLKNGVNITTFEVHAVYNGTAPCGTVYAIVDAQAASQLVEVEITSTSTTIDLDITAASAGTQATIYGKAKY